MSLRALSPQSPPLHILHFSVQIFKCRIKLFLPLPDIFMSRSQQVALSSRVLLSVLGQTQFILFISPLCASLQTHFVPVSYPARLRFSRCPACAQPKATLDTPLPSKPQAHFQEFRGMKNCPVVRIFETYQMIR